MRGRCTNCGKKCSDEYCSEECRIKGEAYFDKLNSLSETKIVLCVIAYFAILILVAVINPKYVWLAFLPVGIFCLFWPYVNNDTMKFMSIRTGKLILKLFGVLIIAVCIVGTYFAFQ